LLSFRPRNFWWLKKKIGLARNLISIHSVLPAEQHHHVLGASLSAANVLG
jgi:hypothetical protein